MADDGTPLDIKRAEPIKIYVKALTGGPREMSVKLNTAIEDIK